jgi:light-regulated signal transduction histidine kinase (bacteriophytochrome)
MDKIPAQEPMQTLRSIQPHGALIVLADSDLSITHVSSNVGDFSDISAAEARGARITAIVGATNAEQLESALRAGDLVGFNPMKMMLAARGVLGEFECTVYRAQGSFVIELQPYIEPPQGFEF